MSKFTKEWIAKVRLSSHLIEPPAAEVIGERLDEIQRLQERVQELEATISNQSKLVYKFKNLSSDLRTENDLLKNNPEAEKYYYQKWMEGKQRIAELEDEQRWIPVGEWKLVSSIDLYWVVDNNLCYYEAYRFEDKWYTYSGDNRIYPTHYRSLPQPPKDGNE